MKHIKTFESVSGSPKVDKIIEMLGNMKKIVSRHFDSTDYEISYGEYDGFYNLEFEQDLDLNNLGELDITDDEINLNEVTIYIEVKFVRKNRHPRNNISDILKERREDLDLLENISNRYPQFELDRLTIEDKNDMGLFYSIMLNFELKNHFNKVDKLFKKIND